MYLEDGDMDKAREFLQMAHERGNVYATFNLGQLYSKEKNTAMALKLWLCARSGGHDQAALCIAMHYFTDGNMKKAFKYSKEAHDLGNENGTFLLGKVYAKEGNNERALQLWESSYERGNTQVASAIAYHYAEQSKISKAAEWYKVAYQTGWKTEDTAQVMVWLSESFAEGCDVQQDLNKAMQFYTLAKEAGASSEDLAEAKEELEDAMRKCQQRSTVAAGMHEGMWRSREAQIRSGQCCTLFDPDPITLKFPCKHIKPIRQPHWTCCGATSYDVPCMRTLDSQKGLPKMMLTTLIFHPGSSGAVGEADTGKIVSITPGGQAAAANVKPGWLIFQVDGRPYSASLLNDAVNGVRDYAITFQHEVESIPTDVLDFQSAGRDAEADVQTAIEASLHEDFRNKPDEAAQIAAALLQSRHMDLSEIVILELNNSSAAFYEALREPKKHPQLMACIKSMVESGCMPAASAPSLPTRSGAKVFVHADPPHSFYSVLESIDRAKIALKNWHVVVSPDLEEAVRSIIKGLPRSKWGGHGGQRIKRCIRLPVQPLVKEKRTFIDVRQPPSLHSGPSGGPRVTSDSGVPNPRAVVSSSALHLLSE